MTGSDPLTPHARRCPLAEWRGGHPLAVAKAGRWGEVWEDGDAVWLPPRHPEVVAGEACLSRAGYDIAVLGKDEYDAVLLAVIDAEPDGPHAQWDAAERSLRSVAVAGGWEQFLDLEG